MPVSLRVEIDRDDCPCRVLADETVGVGSIARTVVVEEDPAGDMIPAAYVIGVDNLGRGRTHTGSIDPVDSVNTAASAVPSNAGRADHALDLRPACAGLGLTRAA